MSAADEPAWSSLVAKARAAAGNDPAAVTALMRAAAMILQERFGPAAAVDLMMEMTMVAASEMRGCAAIVATKH